MSICFPWIIKESRLFGATSLPHGFTLPDLPAFASLTYLQSTQPLPWDLVCLPNLTTLSFRLDSEVDYPDHLDMTRTYPAPQAPTSNLKHLTVEVTTDIILRADWDEEALARYEFFQNIFLPNLPALTSMRLRLRPSSKYFHPDVKPELHSFDRVAKWIRSTSLEALVVECVNPWEEEKPCFIDMAKSLAHLPRLRLLVAPQMFLHSALYSCELPASIESLDIIEPFDGLEYFAEHMRASRALHPRLRMVVLWCDSKVQQKNLSDDLDGYWRQLVDAGVNVHWKQFKDFDWESLKASSVEHVPS
jgi:hypothetical protein